MKHVNRGVLLSLHPHLHLPGGLVCQSQSELTDGDTVVDTDDHVHVHCVASHAPREALNQGLESWSLKCTILS